MNTESPELLLVLMSYKKFENPLLSVAFHTTPRLVMERCKLLVGNLNLAEVKGPKLRPSLACQLRQARLQALAGLSSTVRLSQVPLGLGYVKPGTP